MKNVQRRDVLPEGEGGFHAEFLRILLTWAYPPPGWPEPNWTIQEDICVRLCEQLGILAAGKEANWLPSALKQVRQALEGESVAIRGRFHREGDTMHYVAPDWRTALLLALSRLLDTVRTKIKLCPMEGCGRLFLPNRRQLACSLAHAQRIRRERWEEKHQGG